MIFLGMEGRNFGVLLENICYVGGDYADHYRMRDAGARGFR